MPKSIRMCRRIATAIAVGSASLALVNTADAVDLRDWGRKFPASERFVVLTQFTNQAVLDKETQLVWARTPDSVRMTWQNADGTCIRASIGGRRGWRLPSRSEFMTLIDPAASPPVMLPAGHPFTVSPPAGTGYFWTSDSYIPTAIPTTGSTQLMANIYITTGGVYYSYVTGENAIPWCVRGPSQ